jgi:uncharacterized protein (DUF362 family)
VYAEVRRLLAQAGLDAVHYGTPVWNPLREYVRPGDKVFVLCNFVYHRRLQETSRAFQAKCTHASVLRPLLDYLLKAVGPEGRVEFGNAPLQSCDWDRVLKQTGALELVRFYDQYGAPVSACDLRGHLTRKHIAGVTSFERRGGLESTVCFDLASSSYLSALPGNARFRVSDYDTRETDNYHCGGRHIYEINRRVIDANVIVSVPKLKTHEKVGLTACLKGFVGAVALKQCLAHHRAGSSRAGGDEMPTDSPVLRWVSSLNASAAMLPVGSAKRVATELIERTSRRLLKRLGFSAPGAWPGNDTAWRMTLDLATILACGTADGHIAEVPVRKHLALVDGVVAGEGQGPLSPTPINARSLLFSDDIVLADWACSLLAGFDAAAIPMLRTAVLHRFGTIAGIADQTRAYISTGDKTGGLGDLSKCCVRPFRPPRGWEAIVGA